MNARLRILAVSLLVAGVGCKPSPDEIKLSTSSGQRLERNTWFVEGDLIAVRTTPADGDENMDLCVTARSSAPEVVRVERVEDKCRFFVLSGSSAGRAIVTLEARSGTSRLYVEVTPR